MISKKWLFDIHKRFFDIKKSFSDIKKSINGRIFGYPQMNLQYRKFELLIWKKMSISKMHLWISKNEFSISKIIFWYQLIRIFDNNKYWIKCLLALHSAWVMVFAVLWLLVGIYCKRKCCGVWKQTSNMNRWKTELNTSVSDGICWYSLCGWC